MKKLLIALTAAASAFGLYADVAIGGAGFDSVDAAPLTWTATDGFDADYWSGTEGTMTLVTPGDSGKLSTERPEGYSVTDRDGYMALKTTLGTPVFQNVKTSGAVQTIDPNFFYDGLVQFTAFDETPDMTAYTDAKIGIFPMLENPDSETAYLWVYANGGTNLWKTTTEIDGAWHRVTIKMIKNVTRTAGAVSAGFVVFVDGEAVNCVAAKAAFDGLDLNPAALAYFNNGQLFRSLAPTANEFTGVAYDGQGLLDEVGFTDLAGAPDFALDENWATVSWTSGKIAKVYITDGENVVAESETGFVDFVRAAETTYYYYYDAAPGYIGIPAADAVEITAATTAITDEPAAAAFEIGSTPYATWADAVEAASGEATITVKGAYTMDADDLAASINNEGNVTTIDFAGNVLTGCVNADTAIKFVDSSEGTAGGIAGVALYAADEDNTLYAVQGSALVTVEAGQFDGLVLVGNVDEKTISGGTFKEVTGDTENFYLADYVVEGLVPVYAEGYWTLEADTSFMVTVAAAVTPGSYIASIVVDSEPVEEPTAGDFKAETSVVVTYAVEAGYKFTDPTLAEQTLTAAGSTTAPAVEALPIVAYIATVPYYTLGAAIDAVDGGTITLADNYTLTADETKLFAKNATLDLNGKTLTIPMACRAKNDAFGVAANATVTFQNGTIDLPADTNAKGSGYGIAVYGTLNANCKITREGTDAGPIFDIFGATVNAQAAADLTSTGDVFRFKDEDVTSTVTVVAGAKAEATGTQPIFYNYKKGHTASITITGGQFKQTGTGAIFGGAKDYTQMIWNVTKMDATPAFNTASIENAYAKDMVIPTQKAVLGEDEWYHLADAVKVTTLTVGEGATLEGVVLGDKFAAGETVAFTVTADDEKVKVIDTVTVNSETLTAPYSWTVPATLPESIAIVVTTKAPGSPIIDPTDPESKQTVEAANETEAIAKAEVGVPEAAKDAVDAATYKTYFNFTATDIGGGKFEVAISGLKAEVVEAPTTADLVAKFDEIGEDGLTVTAKPGLFYGVKQAGAVDGVAAAKIDAADGVATGTTVTLPVQKQGDAGFYKVVVDVKPFN